MLDEIDKLGARPAGVLLEVLDPSQHDRFHDAFVELPFDLSGVLFITTANEPDRIPPALRDRLEMIELSGYTEAEKIAIAETHLVEAQIRAAGLAATPVWFTRGGRLPAGHSRLHERTGHPPACPLPADDLPQGDAGPRDRRRRAGP